METDLIHFSLFDVCQGAMILLKEGQRLVVERERETAHMHFIKHHCGGCRALLVVKERAAVVV